MDLIKFSSHCLFIHFGSTISKSFNQIIKLKYNNENTVQPITQ